MVQVQCFACRGSWWINLLESKARTSVWTEAKRWRFGTVSHKLLKHLHRRYGATEFIAWEGRWSHLSSCPPRAREGKRETHFLVGLLEDIYIIVTSAVMIGAITRLTWGVFTCSLELCSNWEVALSRLHEDWTKWSDWLVGVTLAGQHQTNTCLTWWTCTQSNWDVIMWHRSRL